MPVHNSVHHYENFPVASVLLPRHARPAVQALYRFARSADNIADEVAGSLVPHQARLNALQALYDGLDAPAQDGNPLIRDLAPFIANRSLPVQYLQQLLNAFMQDVHQDANTSLDPEAVRHTSMDSLLDYCSRSANPVGRLMLHALGASCNAASFAASDAICTSLQLINFWQDLAKDALAGRLYVPQDVFEQHGSPSTPNAVGYVPMMQALCLDARQRMLSGTVLLTHLSGRFKAEIAMTIAGGLRILDKMSAVNYDVIHRRPTLSWRDTLPCLRIVWQLYLGRLK